MPISLDEVHHVARLARLELDEAELLAFQAELNALLGHFQDLQSYESFAMVASSAPTTLQNVWAEDAIRSGLTRDEAMRNAPITKAGLFVVPTIIED